jgi:hypothetical protein
MAREILDGFGDANLGEWTENREKAFHLRRRLTEKEKEGIGEAVACGVEEGVSRLKLIADFMPNEGLLLARAELAERTGVRK